MISGKSIARSALVVMGATLFSRLFGFLREMVIAGKFGLTGDTDAYLVAFTVPSTVALAVAGAVSAGFIPVLNSYFVSGEREDANRIANILINVISAAMLVLSVLAMLNSRVLVSILAPGFEGDTAVLAADLIRIMFPAVIFVSLMGVASGFLNSHQHFLFPALGPSITSIVIIGAALVLGPVMGIKGLAVGTMAGFACQFLFQVPVMYRKGFRYRPDFAVMHPGVVRVFKLMVPVLAASMAPPIMMLFERGLASKLGEGSISALNYAYRLMQLPLGLFLMAVSVPLFPALSSFAARKEFSRLKETLIKGISVLAVILIPASAGLIALNVPIVRLLFERGAFRAEDTVPTAYALAVYAVALLPLAVRDIFKRGFYALQDTMTPVAVTAGALVINIGLDLALVRIMGIGGLALGAALSALAEAAALYMLLKGRLGGLPGKHFVVLLLKITAASAVMGVLAYSAGGIIGARIDLTGSTGRLIQVGISVAAGFLVYVAAVLLLRVQEVREAAGMLKGLIKKVTGRSA